MIVEQVKSIYVGNLPDKDVDEGKVRNVFSGYGKVSPNGLDSPCRLYMF